MNPFAKQPAHALSNWGESRLIQEIRACLGDRAPASPHGPGDDCAVLPAPQHRLLITVDPVIYGHHFDDAVSPAQAGAKLVKRNLSDLAAMGGLPSSAVLALTLDPAIDRHWLRAFVRGIARAAAKYDVRIVGGDLSQVTGTIVATLTLMGRPAGRRVLTRCGARPGDFILVTGQLGNTLASGHHYRFTPRLREGAWLATQPAVVSMMDVSDGLAKDLPSLTPPNCRAELDPSCLPCRRGAGIREALVDGEDYELVFTVRGKLPTERLLRDWRDKFPHTKLTRIGAMRCLNTPSASGSLNPANLKGYEHLQ